MGHKLQLVYGDVFLVYKNIINLNKTVFGIMGEFTSGQGALKFKELTEELYHPTVSNKKNQETWWFRNMPTLYIYYGREEQAAAAAGNITEQKVMKRKVEEISNGKTTAFAVGVNQLLDSYAAASLSAQHLRFFPTTVLKEVKCLQEKLKLWAEEWSWSKESLYHTTIGTPVQIINDLKEGMYKPNMTKGVEECTCADEGEIQPR